ncbi:MAG: electron transport complex subunit E [Oscillospiraceae bacterium]|nr:electron transport complex subunit E [Oscillospiraceae bacterium]MBQ7013062.1 electron transport complex subunit E [Oscillospiraceae bacterium]
MNKRFSVFEGLLGRNAVLAQGMVIAPIVVCCTTLPRALIVCLAFALLTFSTVLIGSFYPRRLFYAVRVVLYAVTSAVLFVPVNMLCLYLEPQLSGSELFRIYLPLLAVNSFVVLHSELYFYRRRRTVMCAALFFHILGFCLTAACVGVVREILAYGTICGHVVDMPLLLQGTAAPWAGFILLGLFCALHRRLFPNK